MNDQSTSNIGRATTRFLGRRGGASAAEFALTMPVLVLLLFGTIEVGRAMHDYQLVDKSVRHATRYLSRVDLDCAGAGTFDAVDEANARNLALTGTVDGSGNYLLKYWTDPTTITIVPDCIDNITRKYKGAFDADQVPSVTMTATVPIFLNFGSSSLPNLSINVVVRHEEVVFGD